MFGKKTNKRIDEIVGGPNLYSQYGGGRLGKLEKQVERLQSQLNRVVTSVPKIVLSEISVYDDNGKALDKWTAKVGNWTSDPANTSAAAKKLADEYIESWPTAKLEPLPQTLYHYNY